MSYRSSRFRLAALAAGAVAALALPSIGWSDSRRAAVPGGPGPEPGGASEWIRFPLVRATTDADYYDADPRKVELGRLLFFDKILSGNKNISCATCHHPLTASSDFLSLPVGEGGVGLGPARSTVGRVPARVPRNSPVLFNLGAREFERMFHDGRAEVDEDEPRGFRSPAGKALPKGLDNVLAVQAMFPVTSTTEMAGQDGENPIGTRAAAGDLQGVWELLAGRVQKISGYVELFTRAFVDVRRAEDIRWVHAANAIAAFETVAFRADDSPFDRFLRGELRAMSGQARRGMRLFYGEAGCSSCHGGVFQTGHGFHAIGVPQIGPGKGDNMPGFNDGLDDFGRQRVTGLDADRFRFRAPSLRNVSLSGPWGHDGAYNTLEAMVRHHLDPSRSLEEYDTAQAVLPYDEKLSRLDFLCHASDPRRSALEAAIELPPVALTERKFADLMEFLRALTDPASFDLRNEVPQHVPSGLPVADM